MANKKILGPPIPSGNIVPEIREMAVSWNGHYSDGAIWNTMKLASDCQYVCIDLMKQFCSANHFDPALVELFFMTKDKK